jgi:hypothetical protein
MIGIYDTAVVSEWIATFTHPRGNQQTGTNKPHLVMVTKR